MDREQESGNRLAAADFDLARQEMLAAFRRLDRHAQQEAIAETLSAMRQLSTLQWRD